MKRKKILIFVTGGVGGAERVTLTIAKLIDKQKFSPTIIVTDKSSCQLSQFMPADIPVRYLEEPHLRLSCFLKVLKEIRANKPDYVFASMSLLCIMVVLCCKYLCTGTKAIVRGQINPSHWGNKGLIPNMVKYLFPKAYKVVAQTPKMAEEFVSILGIPKEKVVQLYNPIDTMTIDEKIKEESPFANTVGFKYVAVGRCAYQKGYDLLLKAFGIVLSNKPNSRLFIIGSDVDDEYCKSLHATAKQLKIEEKVSFVGFSSNPYKYIYNSDCYVLSSRDEGLPNVLIEATYLNKQSVAYTCIPMIKEIIQDGINGLLVQPNSIEKLAIAMIKIQEMNLNVASLYKPSTSESFNNLFS